MKPVSFTFKNKAQTEVKKYFDLTPFCAAQAAYCLPNIWIEVGINFCLKEDKSPYVYKFNTFVRASKSKVLKSHLNTEEISNMPKYVDVRNFTFEFGKDSDTQQLNLRYRYFKVMFSANIDPLSYFFIWGSPLKLVHDLPLFDYNSTSKQVTNFKQNKLVTLQSPDNNFYNVSIGLLNF